jgi:uncharacterized protein (TIRG00374 family)
MKNKLFRSSTLFSLFCGVILIIALMSFARVDGGKILNRLSSLDPAGLAALIGLWSVYTIVSAEKWLLIERHYNAKNIPSHSIAFALTALGWVAGQVSPVQVATAFMRGLGSKILVQRNAWHSAAATLYEQAFDLMVVALLGIVSIFCLISDLTQIWLMTSVLLLAFFTLTLRFSSALMQKLLLMFSNARLLPQRVKQVLAGSDKMLDLLLVRKLVLFSILRFALLCFAAAMTTYAANMSVPAVHLAMAMPIVALASLLPLTPGALGVNEFVFASVLAALGTPFELGLQWALINRLLMILSSLLIGTCGVFLLLRRLGLPTAG